jgi:D-alanyl-D-alanine carboxypeptidase
VASHRADGSAFRRPSAPTAARPRARGGRHATLRRSRSPQPSWLAVPKVAVIAALGVTTIFAPLAGDVVNSAGSSAEAAPAAAARQASPVPAHFSVLSALAEGDVPDSVERNIPGIPTAEQLAATREAAGRASRDLERRTLEDRWVEESVPGCDPTAIDVGAANGRLDTSHLCELWGTGHLLRADAAVALARLAFAYRTHFRESLVITDSYRSYGAQARLAARKPGLAARPGTSEHGWGLAVDFGGGVEAADEHYAWLLENAPAFGWDNPAWARKGGSGPYEPWHFEYVARQ